MNQDDEEYINTIKQVQTYTQAHPEVYERLPREIKTILAELFFADEPEPPQNALEVRKELLDEYPQLREMGLIALERLYNE